MEWQPIETAPRDGTKFVAIIRAVGYSSKARGLILDPHFYSYAVCYWGTTHAIEGGWKNAFIALGHSFDVIPTHWHEILPLPADCVRETTDEAHVYRGGQWMPLPDLPKGAAQ